MALTQRDLREVQLASGAIRAGIELLLKRQGLKPKDLDRVLLAGGFGNYIRRGNAQRIGLLPARASSTSGSATKATPRWPGPGWWACRGVAGRRARSLPHEPSTSIFPWSRILPRRLPMR